MSKTPPAPAEPPPVGDFDWSSPFPPARIRTQIQQEDDNIGCLPKKTLQLISICSALLLRKIVQAGIAASAKDSNINTATAASRLVLSAKDLQEGIRQSPDCLDFLEAVVAQAVRDDEGKIARYKKKRKTISKPSASSAKMAKRFVTDVASGISDETLDQAVAVSESVIVQKANNKSSITLDEDDYD